jgi:hypothetical protein
MLMISSAWNRQLNLYKRGTAHLALGHTHKALDDFEAVLALTEFDQVDHPTHR